SLFPYTTLFRSRYRSVDAACQQLLAKGGTDRPATASDSRAWGPAPAWSAQRSGGWSPRSAAAAASAVPAGSRSCPAIEPGGWPAFHLQPAVVAAPPPEEEVDAHLVSPGPLARNLAAARRRLCLRGAV